MDNSYIVVEIMSITVLGILLYANFFETDHHTKRKNYFTNLLIVVFTLAIVDLITWFNLDWAKMSTLLVILMSITYVFSFLVQLSFAEYLYVYISEKVETKKWLFLSNRVYSILLCIVSIYMCATGKLFYVENGVWHSGEYETIYYLLYLISLLYLLLIIILNAKKLGLHDFFAAFSFAFLPLVSIAIAVATGVNLGVPLISIDALIIYVMLEADKEDTLIYWSNYDELTGLFNRRAYEKDLCEMSKNIPDDLVFLAADVNGLKQINDNIGHDAGDEIITGAAKALKNVLEKYGKVYRIGGDEFVALLNIKEDKLAFLKEALEDETDCFEGKNVDTLSISAGFVSKIEYPNANIEELAKIADERMYKDKTLYYKKRGFDRRSQKDAHKVLCESYAKILRVDLNNDSCQIIDMNIEEKDDTKGFSDKISDWLKNFAETGNVHQDDLEVYLKKTDFNYIKNHFASGKKNLCVFYRRKYGNQFKNTMMEIIPVSDYHDDNQCVYLYIKKIDE